MTLYDNDELQAAFDQAEQEYAMNPALASKEVEEDLSFWESVGDVAMAPVRGVVGAVEGIYSLADTLAFDILPDAEENFGLGGSQTFAGSAIETIVQFGVGFAAPGIGGLSIASKLGKVGKIGKMVDAGNKAIVAQQKAQRYVPALLTARGMEAGKYAVAGAIADFTVFDGHEQRLSNLIQEIPGLENPITEFLAADEEDPELVGRMKAALEGAGLGVMIDGVLLGVRAMRAGVKAGPDKKAASIALAQRQKELLAEQAEEAAEKTTDDVVGTPANKTDEEVVETPKVVDEAVEETTPKTADELRDELLDPENAGGNARMTLEAIDARVAEKLAESTERVKGSSRPFKTESAEEFDDAVTKQSIEDRQKAMREDAEFVDEAAGTNMTILERQLQDMGEMTGEAREAAIKHRYRLGAARELLQKVGNDTHDLIKKATSPEGTRADLARFLLMQTNYKTLANNLRAVQSEWGRNLQSINRGTGDTTAGTVMRGIPEEDALKKFSMENLKDDGMVNAMIDVYGGEAAVRAEMAKFKAVIDANGGDVGKALKYNRGKFGLTGAVTEWWMNSILSGPTTMIVNGVSGLATTVLAPLERSAGFALAGNMDKASIEFGRLLAMPSHIADALKYAKVAMKSGDGQLENIGGKADERAIGQSRIEGYLEQGPLTRGMDQDSNGMVASKWIARNVVNAPGKLLLGTDEFFKQLNYRTTMKAELYKQALDEGMDSKLIDAYVEKEFGRLVADGQKLTADRFVKEAKELFDETDPDYAFNVHTYVTAEMKRYSPLADRALAAARETTFTTPLSKDRGPLSALGKMTSDATNAYPPLKLVIPFVRTPTNIMQYVFDRVPFAPSSQRTAVQNRLSQLFDAERKALSSASQEEQADALGRLATGSIFATAGFMAAMNGGITGGGPTDTKQRKIKEQTGWQPYSIKVGDSYISYRRLDPFASFLGITADLVDIMQQGDEEQRKDAMDVALGVVMSVSKNITSKTYLQGIRDVTGLLFEPEMYAKGFAEKTIASLIVPNVAAQFARAGQGEMTDIRNLTDAIKARVPGMSGEVPPRRNMLGEPIMDNGINAPVDLINPFAYSTVKDDKMMAEFDQIGHGFSAPRSFKNGVELRDYKNRKGQSAYDRWQELSGTMKVGGRTLKQEINKLMKSSQYKRLPYEALDGLDKSPRARLIQSILNKYRSKAFNEMLREFPEVGKRNKINNMIKGRRTAGRDYNDLLALIEE